MIHPACGAAVLALALAACAAPGSSDTLVVVMPGKTGPIGGVVVNPGSESQQLLDKPYAAARAGDGKVEKVEVSPEQVQKQFGRTLEAQPALPSAFTLYFILGTDRLTPESAALLPEILSQVQQRPVADILVVGHTDSTGSDPMNTELSRQRADRMRDQLVRRGIAPGIVRAIGRGEREPLVVTADETDEPRNRRVEIIVR